MLLITFHLPKFGKWIFIKENKNWLLNYYSENSTVNWTDIPSSGVDSETLKHPAPTLVLVKNATEAAKDSTAINQSSDAHSSDAYSLGLGSFPLIVTISALAMLL